MSHFVTIPFYSFLLELESGQNFLSPLVYPDLIYPGDQVDNLTTQFQQNFQQKVINKGDYLSIMDLLHSKNFHSGQISVHLEAHKNQMSYPSMNLDYQYYYQDTKRGQWVLVPALGIEFIVEEEHYLDKMLTNYIQLEFIRKHRLNHAQNLLQTIWYKEIKLLQKDVKIEFYSLTKLQQLNENKTQEILPKVAQKLEINKPVLYGMKQEISQALKALKNPFNKNLLLVGPSGVGKTTLVWELDRWIKQEDVSTQIWETTASILIKELTQDIGWQENIAYLCKDLTVKGDFLFVRNLMELFEVGQYEGNNVSIAEYLKPYLNNGEINLITECTDEELAQIELKSPNYTNLFQIIRLEEPKKELENIILKKVNDLAKASKIEIELDAIEETIRLNKRYTPYSGFPGKPIRFLESIIIHHNKIAQKGQPIRKANVIQHFCEETNMPLFMVNPEIPMNPEQVKENFKTQLFGQDAAVDSVVDVFSTIKTALARQGKPIASFLFVGPTGVGKTEMARILAQFMFGDRDKIIRFDMSEYSSPYNVLRLMGIGSQQEGLLTSAVRREPFAVLLFDEIEKADSSFYDLLLQLLDEGRLSDSQGKVVNFCSTIIIMTSNIGAEAFQNNRISWGKGIDTSDVNNHFMTSVEKYFRPELFNRIDRIIPFAPLKQETMQYVVRREIKLIQKREGILYRKLNLSIHDEVLEHLGQLGYNQKYGARFLQRIIREKLITPLAKMLNQYEKNEQLEVNVELIDHNGSPDISITIKTDAMQFQLMLEELQQNNLADALSQLRRKAYQLSEGKVYLKMESELDMLKIKKKKKAKEFWDNHKESQKYTHLLQIKEQVSKIIHQIEELEMELSLTVMNFKPYQPQALESKKNLEKKFKEIQLNMYNHLYPKDNDCYVALMGLSPKKILDFYLPIFNKKNWVINNVMGLWYNEEHYLEEIEHEEDKNQKLVPLKKPRHDYLILPINLNKELHLSAKQKKDFLCGIIFQINAPAILMYLHSENGRVDIEDANNKIFSYHVMVSSEKPNYPTNIHRKEYFLKQLINKRRIIKLRYLKDDYFKIDRKVNKDEHWMYILQHLDMLFEDNINKMFLS